MPENDVLTWLEQKRLSGMRSAMMYAAATLAGGISVLVVMFYLIFLLTKSTILPLIVIGLIFADSIRSKRDDMAFIPTWLLREYINIGPRLILHGWPNIRLARRFSVMDTQTCSAVLGYLAGRTVPATKDELLKLFPTVSWVKLTDDLGLLPGVIFFRPDGLRVILIMPLRSALRRLLGFIPETEVESQPVDQPEKLSPSEILGIPATATLTEIKYAYRTRIKECHPDRFACMDEQSRSLAEEWSKSLNAAYEFMISEARRRNET